MEKKKKEASRRMSPGDNKEGEPRERQDQKEKDKKKKQQLKRPPKEERPETKIGKEKRIKIDWPRSGS